MNSAINLSRTSSSDNTLAPGQAFKVANIGAGESRGDLSRQWIARPADERFLSLSDLHAHVNKRAEESREIKIDNRGFDLIAPSTVTSMADTHKLTIGLPDGVERAFTHWSFGQLAQLGKAPASYLRTIPSQIAADALQYSLRYNRETEDVKTYINGSELMAVTGPDYGRIFDREVVAATQQVAGNGTGDTRWKVPGVMDWRTMIYDPKTPITKETTTLFASDRDVFIFLVDDMNPIVVGKTKDGADDIMFRGFYITNSEMGRSSLRLAAFYLRAVCCNRIMWGVEGFQEITMRHSKYAPSRFMEEARPALKSFADGGVSRLIDGVEKAKAAKLARNDDDALEFLNARFSKLRSQEIIESVEREEGHKPRSAWDFAQGITAIARNENNTDTRVDMELTARKILDKIAA